MAAEDIFNYLNDLYDLLPERDRLRFGELWKAYEQSYGDVWIKLFERDFGATMKRVPLYNNQRWVRHEFGTKTQTLRAASYRTTQDLSKGINLSQRYLIRLAVDELEPIEINLLGKEPTKMPASEIVQIINNAIGFELCRSAVLGSLIDFRSRLVGPLSQITFFPASRPANDASALVLGLDPESLPITYPKYRYEYLLSERTFASIPRLQTQIHEEGALFLKEGVDYEIELGSGIISFRDPPPQAMWAKNNLLNLETPYNNFGFLLDIYDRNTSSYLKAVKGLWFAFWTGPRPENIRRSLYLLFGLPTASDEGSVVSVSDKEVTLQYTDGRREGFSIPSGLLPEVTEGQSVTRFQPLVTGISVMDKVNAPGFIEREIFRYGIQYLMTDNATRGEHKDTDESKALRLIEENTYLPQIDVNAFVRSDIKLSNVKTFLRNIQPRSRTFLFQVLVATIREYLELKELLGVDVSFDVSPNLDYHPGLGISQEAREGNETASDQGNVLDSEGFSFADYAEIEISRAGEIVDSFKLEG